MKQTGTRIVSLIFVAVMGGIAAWIYPHLPAQTAIHWDDHGVADGWAPRFWAAAFPVLLMAGLALLFAILPVISPRKFEIAPFTRVYGIIVLATLAFLLVVGTVALLAGAGYHVSMELVAPIAVGALLMVIGTHGEIPQELLRRHSHAVDAHQRRGVGTHASACGLVVRARGTGVDRGRLAARLARGARGGGARGRFHSGDLFVLPVSTGGRAWAAAGKRAMTHSDDRG